MTSCTCGLLSIFCRMQLCQSKCMPVCLFDTAQAYMFSAPLLHTVGANCEQRGKDAHRAREPETAAAPATAVQKIPRCNFKKSRTVLTSGRDQFNSVLQIPNNCKCKREKSTHVEASKKNQKRSAETQLRSCAQKAPSRLVSSVSPPWILNCCNSSGIKSTSLVPFFAMVNFSGKKTLARGDDRLI